MIEQYEHYLDCKNHLRRNIKIYVEAFVKYYGEEHRQEIEKKFYNTLYEAYIKPESIPTYLDKIKKEYTKEFGLELIKQRPSRWTVDDLFKFYKLSNANLLPIHGFKLFYNQYIIGYEGRIKEYKNGALEVIKKYVPEFTMEDLEYVISTKSIPSKYDSLSSNDKEMVLRVSNIKYADERYRQLFEFCSDLLRKINPNVTIDTINSIADSDDFKALVKYAELLPDYLDKYNELMSKYKLYEREVACHEQLQKLLDIKYYLKLIEENKDLLNYEDQKKLQEALKQGNPYILGGYVNKLFGGSISSNGLLEAFSRKSQQQLEDAQVSDWKKKSIMKERIEYFKLNGIDLGDDYEAYQKNDAAKNICPPHERIVEYLASKNKLSKEYKKEYYLNTPRHRAARKEIEYCHFVGADTFDEELYNDIGYTYIEPNAIKTPNGYELFSLAVICCNFDNGMVDHQIVHEFNHLYEARLIADNSLEAISGWDRYSINKDTLEKKERPYQLFNEIINELIAQDIHKEMLKDNIYIFDNKDTVKLTYTTEYESYAVLAEDFYKEYKDDIIKSRNDSMEIIWNKVGKENFEALNDLINEFYQKFCNSYMELFNLLFNNEDTSQTRLYHTFAERKDAILNNMREYKNSFSR